MRPKQTASSLSLSSARRGDYCGDGGRTSLSLRLLFVFGAGAPRRTSARLARPPGPRGVNGLQSDELKCVSRRGVVGGCPCKVRELRRSLRPPPLTEAERPPDFQRLTVGECRDK